MSQKRKPPGGRATGSGSGGGKPRPSQRLAGRATTGLSGASAAPCRGGAARPMSRGRRAQRTAQLWAARRRPRVAVAAARLAVGGRPGRSAAGRRRGRLGVRGAASSAAGQAAKRLLPYKTDDLDKVVLTSPAGASPSPATPAASSPRAARRRADAGAVSGRPAAGPVVLTPSTKLEGSLGQMADISIDREVASAAEPFGRLRARRPPDDDRDDPQASERRAAIIAVGGANPDGSAYYVAPRRPVRAEGHRPGDPLHPGRPDEGGQRAHRRGERQAAEGVSGSPGPAPAPV